MSLEDMVQDLLRFGNPVLEKHLAIRQIAEAEAEAETGPSSPLDPDPPFLDMVPRLEDLDLGPGCKLEPANALGLCKGTLKEKERRPVPVLIEYKKWRMSENQDYMSLSESDFQDHLLESENEIQRLAQVLASAGSLHLSTLEFRGYINQEEEKRYAFVFEYPRDSEISEPVTLNDAITSPDPDDHASLFEIRFHIARVLTRSLSAFHADGWVHESICSQSVVFFRNHDSKTMYHKPYLVNFEYARPATGDTSFASSEVLSTRVYLHPERQQVPPKKFRKEHDLYSLGVVLLELGLWESAVSLCEDAIEARERDMEEQRNIQGSKSKSQDGDSHASDTDDHHTGAESHECSDSDSTSSSSHDSDEEWQDALEGCLVGEWVATPSTMTTTTTTKNKETVKPVVTQSAKEKIKADSESIRELFLNAARSRLPRAMGLAYSRAVQACLSAEFASGLRQTQLGMDTINDVIGLLSHEYLRLDI